MENEPLIVKVADNVASVRINRPRKKNAITFAMWQALAATFEALSADHRGVVSAEVVSALPLTAAQTQGVAAALRTALGKDPEIETRVDPSLLGGIKVRVGSRLFDASLRSKLDSLKFALKRA